MTEELEDKTPINPVIIAVVAVFVLIVVFVVVGQKKEYTTVVAGSEAPNFTLPDLEGNLVSLSDFKGKVIFLNFWATWCETCTEEMPSMEYINKVYELYPFEIIAISVDDADAQILKDFREKFKLTFTILHDRKGNIKDAYKTTGVPETFFIDQNGIIAEKVQGARDWSQLVNLRMLTELFATGPRPAEKYSK
ncbi:MAG: TlpA family protein disulfide reductase [Deltaproteobacteria bacterium]|nr:TlpA family protein disulfide reductase [Deltaproteobacteria bacterium]